MPADNEEQREGDSEAGSDRIADPLRSAVERTLAASAGSASETGQRARDLLDELARRGELAREEVARRGGAARQRVSRRGEAAREDVIRRVEEASRRLSEAIAELKLSDREDLGPLSEGIATIEGRLMDLERLLRQERLGEAPRRADSKAQVEGETAPDSGDSGPGAAGGGSDPRG